MLRDGGVNMTFKRILRRHWLEVSSERGGRRGGIGGVGAGGEEGPPPTQEVCS